MRQPGLRPKPFEKSGYLGGQCRDPHKRFGKSSVAIPNVIPDRSFSLAVEAIPTLARQPVELPFDGSGMLTESNRNGVVRSGPYQRDRLERPRPDPANDFGRLLKSGNPQTRAGRGLVCGTQFETDLRNDRERTQRTRIQLGQIVTRNVFDHASTGLGLAPADVYDLHSDDPVPNRAHCPQRTLRVGRDDSPDRGVGSIPWVQGQHLPVFLEGRLEVSESDAGFHMDGQIGGDVGGDLVKTAGYDNGIDGFERVPRLELGAGADRGDRTGFGTHHVGEFGW